MSSLLEDFLNSWIPRKVIEYQGTPFHCCMILKILERHVFSGENMLFPLKIMISISLWPYPAFLLETLSSRPQTQFFSSPFSKVTQSNTVLVNTTIHYGLALNDQVHKRHLVSITNLWGVVRLCHSSPLPDTSLSKIVISRGLGFGCPEKTPLHGLIKSHVNKDQLPNTMKL